MPVVAITTSLIGLTLLALLPIKRNRVRESTLATPFAWLALAVGIVTLAATSEALLGPLPSWLRYVVMVTTYCPLMALMGARRPHQGGWLFIVITFWIVLALPAIQVRLTRAGDTVEAAGVWSILLLVMQIVLWVTVIPSAYRWGGMVAALGQTLMTAFWLDELPWRMPGQEAAGRLLWLSGLLIVALQPSLEYAEKTPFDRLWLRFRDHFGGLWALRIAERLNAFLAGQAIPLRLRMRGLCDLEGNPAAEEDATPDCWKAFVNLLRRFVNLAWVPLLPEATMTEAPTQKPG